MIDLHAHILPNLDHGAHDWEEALEMCRLAVADGITIMAATPHVSEVFPNSSEGILSAVDELRGRLADAAIPLEIAAGGDYRIDPSLGPDNVLTLNNNGRYFLLEFPYDFITPYSDLFVEGLVRKGLIPIVTHPERIFTLHGNEDRLVPLIERGALVQVTAGSLVGDFGPACLRSATRMLKKGWVHIIATDAHWVDERPPLLSAGRRAAVRYVGETGARRLVIDNPRAIIEGRDLA